MSIQDIPKKIKGVYEESPNILPISAIITLVGFGCFLLGGLSVDMSIGKNTVRIVDSKTNEPYKIIDNSNKIINVENESMYNNSQSASLGVYVASKNGKLYYTSDCKAAGRLSEKTKISWNTKEEAEIAGYVFAESCNK